MRMWYEGQYLINIHIVENLVDAKQKSLFKKHKTTTQLDTQDLRYVLIQSNNISFTMLIRAVIINACTENIKHSTSAIRVTVIRYNAEL